MSIGNIRSKKKPAKSRNQQKTTAAPIFYQSNGTKSQYDFDIVLEKYDNITKIPQVFQKYSKFQHVYPAIFPSRDEIRVEQFANKQKDIGRDISVNRNVKNTKHVKINLADVIEHTNASRKPGDGNNITNCMHLLCMISRFACRSVSEDLVVHIMYTSR